MDCVEIADSLDKLSKRSEEKEKSLENFRKSFKQSHENLSQKQRELNDKQNRLTGILRDRSRQDISAYSNMPFEYPASNNDWESYRNTLLREIAQLNFQISQINLSIPMLRQTINAIEAELNVFNNQVNIKKIESISNKNIRDNLFKEFIQKTAAVRVNFEEIINDPEGSSIPFFQEFLDALLIMDSRAINILDTVRLSNRQSYYYWETNFDRLWTPLDTRVGAIDYPKGWRFLYERTDLNTGIPDRVNRVFAARFDILDPEARENIPPNTPFDPLVLDQQFEYAGIQERVEGEEDFSEEYLQLGKDLFSALGIFVTTVKNPQLYATIINQQKGLSLYDWLKRRDANPLQSEMFKVNAHILKAFQSVHERKFAFVRSYADMLTANLFLNSLRINPDTHEIYFGILDHLQDFRSTPNNPEFLLAMKQNSVEIFEVLSKVTTNFWARASVRLLFNDPFMSRILEDLKTQRISLIKAQAAMHLAEYSVLTEENYGYIKRRPSFFSEGIIYFYEQKIPLTLQIIRSMEATMPALQAERLTWAEINQLDITPTGCLRTRSKRSLNACSSSIFDDEEPMNTLDKSVIQTLYDENLLGNEEGLGKFFKKVPAEFKNTLIIDEFKVKKFLGEEKILRLNAGLFLTHYGRIPSVIRDLIFENREKLTLVPLEDFQENSFYQKLIDIYKTSSTLSEAEKKTMDLVNEPIIQKYLGDNKIKFLHQQVFNAVKGGIFTPDVGLSIFGLGLAFSQKNYEGVTIISALEIYQRVVFPIVSLQLASSTALAETLGVRTVQLLSKTAGLAPGGVIQAYFMTRNIYTLLHTSPSSPEHHLAALLLTENAIELGTTLLAPPVMGTILVAMEMGAFSVMRGNFILNDVEKEKHIVLRERNNILVELSSGLGYLPSSIQEEVDDANEQLRQEISGLTWLSKLNISLPTLWNNESSVPVSLSDSALIIEPSHLNNILQRILFFFSPVGGGIYTQWYNRPPCNESITELSRQFISFNKINCTSNERFKFYNLNNSEFSHIDRPQEVLIADDIVLPHTPFKLLAARLNPSQNLGDNRPDSDRYIRTVGQQPPSSNLRALTLNQVPESEQVLRAWNMFYDTQGKVNNFTLNGKPGDAATILIGPDTSPACESHIKIIYLENNKIHIIKPSNQTNRGEQVIFSGEPLGKNIKFDESDVASNINVNDVSTLTFLLAPDRNNFTKKIHCTQVKELNLLINYSPDPDLTTQVEISKEKIEFFNADQDLGQIMLSKATQRLPSLSISTACNVTVTETIEPLKLIQIGKNFSLTHVMPSYPSQIQISLEDNSRFIYGNNTIHYKGQEIFIFILKSSPLDSYIYIESLHTIQRIKKDEKIGKYELINEKGQINIYASGKLPDLNLRTFYTYGNKTESIFCMWKEISSSDMCLLITSQNSLPARTIFAALDVDLIFMEGKFKNITPALLFNPDSLHQSLFQGLNVLGHEHEKLDLYYFKETLAIQALPSSLKTVNLIPWLNNDFPSLISMQPLYKIKTDNESLRLKFTSNITIILKQAFQSTNQIAFNLNNQTHYISTLENNNLECRITPLLNQNQSIETKLYSNQCSYDFSLCPPISNNINATMSRVTLCQTNLYPQTGNEIILFGGREMSIAGFQSFLLLKASARHSYLDASSHALALVSPPAGRITFENIDFIIPAGACASGFGGGLYQRATELGYGPRWLTQPIAQYTVNLILNYTSLLITYHLQPEEQREQIGMLEKSFIMGAPIASIMIGTWLQEKWGRVPTKLVNQLAFPLLVGCLKQGVGATLVSLSTNPIGLAMSFGLSSLSHAVGDFLGKQTLNVIDKVGQFFNNARGQYVVPETEMGVENANQDFTFFKSRKGLGRESVPMQGIPANDAEVSNRLLARERP